MIEAAPTTVAPAPGTTVAPAPAPAGVEGLSLSCQQNGGWTGVNCSWSMPSTGGSLEVYLLKTGPGATPRERIWGNNPTSYVDVHADGTNTYTYQIEVKTADGTVVGRSGTVSVTMVPVSNGATDLPEQMSGKNTCSPLKWSMGSRAWIAMMPRS